MATNLEYTFRQAIEAEIYPAQLVHSDQIQVTVMEMYEKATGLATAFWSAKGFGDIVGRGRPENLLPTQRRRLPSIPNQQAFAIYVHFKDSEQDGDFPTAAKLH